MPTTKKGKPIEQRLLEYLGHPKYQPLNKTGLAKGLGIPIDDRARFRKTLATLERQGKITRIRKDRYVLPQEADLLVGILQVHPQGFAYVLNETGDGLGDLYVSADNTGTAMHKDRVVARITPEVAAPAKGGRQRANRQGRVIKVLERANKTIVGTLQRSKNFFYVVPDDPALIRDIYIPADSQGAPKPAVNDKVVIALEPWEHRHLNPEGKIIEVLGPARAPGIDILSIIKKHDLAVEFPETALAEASRLSTEIRVSDRRGREDFRSLPVFTIDPEDARDFDDAIHVVRDAKGWEIGIHIADVSHFVRPGSALDREAFRRGNSVYFPDRVLPMLPERLSNGVCSLRPNEEHLTKSVIVRFDRKFRIKGYRFAGSIIRSQNRLTYAEASRILQAPPDGKLSRDLHEAWTVASHLRQRRFASGALELDMPEVRVRTDEQGVAIGLYQEPYDSSHQLIEEFMLLANELVGKETKDRGLPSVYRVHEDPDPVRLAEYRELILSYGIQIGDLTHPQEVQRLLKKIEGSPEEAALKVGLLRSLRKAAYSPDPLGHYGLAKSDYTHFTSPIRRYADLLVHRAFNQMIPELKQGKNLLNSRNLKTVCEHISATERVATDAERESVKLKKLEYFQGLLRKPHRLEAVVVDVRNYGLMVEVPEARMLGLVHISSLDHDFFVFDQARARIFGRRTKEVYQVGDPLQVRVVRVDTFKQQIDFLILSRSGERKKETGNRNPSTDRRGGGRAA